jgi:hypothetical protein
MGVQSLSFFEVKTAFRSLVSPNRDFIIVPTLFSLVCRFWDCGRSEGWPQPDSAPISVDGFWKFEINANRLAALPCGKSVSSLMECRLE